MECYRVSLLFQVPLDSYDAKLYRKVVMLRFFGKFETIRNASEAISIDEYARNE